jgi:hypothetical protein
VVKHRQLAHQVGSFGGFASKTLTDLDNMIFSTGSTFIFGSWICEADDDGKLQGHLLKDSANHEDLFYFDDYDRSTRRKIHVARDV